MDPAGSPADTLSMEQPLITVVLPCFNERELAVQNTRTVHSYLQKLGWNFELLICDDASNDGTTELLENLKEPGIRVVHYTKGPSRRENLGLTLSAGKGDVLVYMDMDLSTDLEALGGLVEPVLRNELDICVGSRYQKGASVQREFFRFFYSFFYNLTIRLLFGSRILDHQCGFKAFRRGVYLDLAKEMGYDESYSRGWFWDAELLIRGQRKGLRIRELPVKWIRAERSSFNFRRELRVIPYMLRLKHRL